MIHFEEMEYLSVRNRPLCMIRVPPTWFYYPNDLLKSRDSIVM